MAITEFNHAKLLDPLQEIYREINEFLLHPLFENLPPDQQGFAWQLSGLSLFISFKTIDPFHHERIIEVTSTGSSLIILRWQGQLKDPSPRYLDHFVDTQIYINARNGQAWNHPPDNHLLATMTQEEAETVLNSLIKALSHAQNRFFSSREADQSNAEPQ